MADSNSKIGNAILILIITIAGYQAITHLGNYFTSEVFKVPEVNFWSILFLIVFWNRNFSWRHWILRDS